jgi:hypothetical protein
MKVRHDEAAALTVTGLRPVTVTAALPFPCLSLV